MAIDKFNFFLDEMILRRNKEVWAKLECENKNPCNIVVQR
jgi:hypothetical protein